MKVSLVLLGLDDGPARLVQRVAGRGGVGVLDGDIIQEREHARLVVVFTGVVRGGAMVWW